MLALAFSIIGATGPKQPPADEHDPTPIEQIYGAERVADARITTDEIWHVGQGSIEGVMRTESDAMVLTRVALGEAPGSINDRIFVMWLIRLRAHLGYKNGKYRGWDPPDDRWGPETSIKAEALCFDGCQFQPVSATFGLYFPANLKSGSPLRLMVYPSDDQLPLFFATLRAAEQIAAAPMSDFPMELRGYDGFRSPSIDWIGTHYHSGGLPSAIFWDHGNVWRDQDAVDNQFWANQRTMDHSGDPIGDADRGSLGGFRLDAGVMQ